MGLRGVKELPCSVTFYIVTLCSLEKTNRPIQQFMLTYLHFDSLASYSSWSLIRLTSMKPHASQIPIPNFNIHISSCLIRVLLICKAYLVRQLAMLGPSLFKFLYPDQLELRMHDVECKGNVTIV